MLSVNEYQICGTLSGALSRLKLHRIRNVGCLNSIHLPINYRSIVILLTVLPTFFWSSEPQPVRSLQVHVSAHALNCSSVCL